MYKLKYYAEIVAQLCDESGKVIDRHQLTLEGEDFALWGFSDQWVIDWVCEKLHLEVDSEHIQVEHLEEQEE
jgi:hypothetical protein